MQAPLAPSQRDRLTRWDQGAGAMAVSQRRRILLAVCLAGMLSMADRQLLGVLLEPIKHDLRVSDTDMGMLSGIAFALFYVIAGIPLSRLADQGSRKTLLLACITTWSVATMLCGLVQSFAQLMLARIAVGGGDAGAGPATQSLIADLYPPERRSSIFGIQVAATSSGIAIGMFASGWLASHFTWRTIFLIMGAPGLLLALFLVLSVREPSREAQAAARPPLRAAFTHILHSPVLIMLLLVGGATGFAGYSIFAWTPTFYLRVHKLTMLETGLWTGLSIAGGLFIGSLVSGFISDRLAKGDPARCMLIGAAGCAASVPFGVIFLEVSNTAISFAALLVTNIFMTVWLPPAYTVMHGAAPGRIRGLMTALMLMFQSLIGAGLGPFAVGFVSDALAPSYGTESIRPAMMLGVLALAVAAALCAMTAWRVARWQANMHPDVQH
jgi:MFS family permease